MSTFLISIPQPCAEKTPPDPTEESKRGVDDPVPQCVKETVSLSGLRFSLPDTTVPDSGSSVAAFLLSATPKAWRRRSPPELPPRLQCLQRWRAIRSRKRPIHPPLLNISLGAVPTQPFWKVVPLPPSAVAVVVIEVGPGFFYIETLATPGAFLFADVHHVSVRFSRGSGPPSCGESSGSSSSHGTLGSRGSSWVSCDRRMASRWAEVSAREHGGAGQTPRARHVSVVPHEGLLAVGRS